MIFTSFVSIFWSFFFCLWWIIHLMHRWFIAAHKDLVPAPREIVSPQGNRSRRYHTGPGENYQMDWGFVKVNAPDGISYQCACFAMICHHCGERYIEFFPNARQETLFIGMIHAFIYIGIPENVLTDNIKKVRTVWSLQAINPLPNGKRTLMRMIHCCVHWIESLITQLSIWWMEKATVAENLKLLRWRSEVHRIC